MWKRNLFLWFMCVVLQDVKAQNLLSKAELFQAKEFQSLIEITGNQNNVFRLRLSSMQNMHDRIAEGKTGAGVHIESIPYQLFPLQILECYPLQFLAMNYHELATIPNEIDQLCYLQFLDLGYNQLQTLPKTLENLTYLEALNLENNAFSTVPAVIYALPKLKIPNLSGNPISERQKQVLREKLSGVKIIF